MICTGKVHVNPSVKNIQLKFKSAVILLACLALAGCAMTTREEMQPVSHVDIDRFMGDWFVIANIPTFPERDALFPIERYERNADGTIKTTFLFTNAKTGEPRKLKATGFIREGSNNAVWGMQFFWPIKADYRIVYLDPDYDTTIVGRNKRDYLWIMSRKKQISEAKLAELIEITTVLGYDPTRIEVSNWQRIKEEKQRAAL